MFLLAKLAAVSLALLFRLPRPLADHPRLKYRTTFLNVFTSFKTSVSREDSLLPSEKDLLLKNLPNNNSILPVNLCFQHFQSCTANKQLKGLDHSYKTLGCWKSRVKETCLVYIISYMQDTVCSCSDDSVNGDGTPLYDQLIKNKSLSWKIIKQTNVTQGVSCQNTKFIPSKDLGQSRDYHHTLEVPLITTGDKSFALNICTSDEVLCEGGTVIHLDTYSNQINVRLDADQRDVSLGVPGNNCSCSAHPTQHKNLSNALHDIYINVSVCDRHTFTETLFNISSFFQSEKYLTLEKCEVTNVDTNKSRIYTSQNPEIISNIVEIFNTPSGEPNHFIASHKALCPLLATAVTLYCFTYACYI